MTPINWDLYNARINVSGSTARERVINKVKDTISRYGSDSISCKDIKIDGVSKKLFITNTSDPYVKNFQDTEKIITSAGTLIEYAGNQWLVEKLDVDDEVYPTGKLRFCNHTLNFLDSSYRPTSRPCYVENTSYGTDETGISISKVNITTGAGTYRIILPYDAQTALFDRTYADTNQNQRIMLLKKSYEITDVDFITQPGCVIITAEECERSADDNVELGIADYNRVKTTSALPRCEITYSGEPVLEYGKAAKTFTAKFYDLDGNLLETTPVWNLVMTNQSLLEFVASATEVNDIYLRVTDKRLIGEVIRIEVENEDVSVKNALEIGVVAIGG